MKGQKTVREIDSNASYDLSVKASGTDLTIFHSTEKDESILELCRVAALMIVQELDDDQSSATERFLSRLEWLEADGVALESLEEVQQFHAFWAEMNKKGHTTSADVFGKYFVQSFRGVIDVGLSPETGAAVALPGHTWPREETMIDRSIGKAKVIRGDRHRMDIPIPKNATAVCIFEHQYSGNLESTRKIPGSDLIPRSPQLVKSKRTIRFGKRVKSYEVLDGIAFGKTVYSMGAFGMPLERYCLFLRRALPNKVLARVTAMHWK